MGQSIFPNRDGLITSITMDLVMDGDGLIVKTEQSGASLNNMPLSTVQTGEFDPGSERTLAACLRHASRTVRPVTLRGNGYTSGARVSNAWVIYPQVWDNSGKLELIPDKTTISSDFVEKGGLFLKAIAC